MQFTMFGIVCVISIIAILVGYLACKGYKIICREITFTFFRLASGNIVGLKIQPPEDQEEVEKGKRKAPR